ncbi:hypothetical protein NGF19_27125 [Streptomyces sp. RY43-2]|uniref:Uncharacterized protein n=1 Tax=Streptomyces macrolidinus TaxID=2952607 RepID=A0ABT0ZLJ9_9ACTN|nr:hypothetical protein [Streptomyces macrolidinus]MCN9244410.1 hypothetical protein [Streptomyces macrolidinus]
MPTGYVADPAAADVVRAALDRADADAGDGCYAPAAQVSRVGDRVRVVIAGRDPAGSAGPPIPWADVAGEPGKSSVSRNVLRTQAARLPRTRRAALPTSLTAEETSGS